MIAEPNPVEYVAPHYLQKTAPHLAPAFGEILGKLCDLNARFAGERTVEARGDPEPDRGARVARREVPRLVPDVLQDPGEPGPTEPAERERPVAAVPGLLRGVQPTLRKADRAARDDQLERAQPEPAVHAIGVRGAGDRSPT